MTKKEKVTKVLNELEKACAVKSVFWTNGCVYITLEKDSVDYLNAITARYGVKAEKISKCEYYRICY